MYAKIMHHFVFLIITFSSFTFCIRNENLIDNAERNTKNILMNNYSSDISPRGNENPPSGSSFVFPDKHRDNVNNLNDVSSVQNSNSHANMLMANNQRENPNNSAINTRAHSHARTNSNDDYYHHYNTNNNNYNNNFNNDNYRYQYEALQHHRQSNQNRNLPNVPIYYRQQAYRTPMHSSQLNYAHNHNNYLYNNRHNYNARPTPPSPQPQPQAPPILSYQRPIQSNLDNTNQHQSPRDGLYQNQQSSLLSSFGTTAMSAIGGIGSNFLNPFGLNSLTNLFSKFGMPSGPTQLIKGLEDIARNDDLQCVPRLLCQTLGNPERRAQFPNFISSPAITSLIAALPASSPALLFGQAALLGLSGGEKSCDTTYRRCPGNEDDLLYYLNNYRGGFFRFFADKDLSDGNMFSSTVSPTKQPFADYHSSNYQTNKYQNIEYTTTTTAKPSSGLNVLANLVDFNGLGGQNGLPTVVEATIGQFFSNIFSGYFNGQGSGLQSRKKRETEIKGDKSSINLKNKSESEDTKPNKLNPIELLVKVLTSVINETNPIQKSDGTSNKNEIPDIEGKILNKANKIFAIDDDDNDKRILFPSEENDNRFNGPTSNGVDFDLSAIDYGQRYPKTEVTFSEIESNHYDYDGNRLGKQFTFNNENRPTYETATKMVFPDTPSFRFEENSILPANRYGKILNRPNSDDSQYDHFTFKGRTDFNDDRSTRAPFYANYRYEPPTRPSTNSHLSYASNSNHYRYTVTPTTQRPTDTDQNIYVTNSKGVIEYYVNKYGNKIYV